MRHPDQVLSREQLLPRVGLRLRPRLQRRRRLRPLPAREGRPAPDRDGPGHGLPARGRVRTPRPGVRARVLLAVLATVALALVGSVVVLERVLVANVDRRVDEGLVQEAAELRQLAGGVDPDTVGAVRRTPAGRSTCSCPATSPAGARPSWPSSTASWTVDRPVPGLQDARLPARWGALDQPERGALEVDGAGWSTWRVPRRGRADGPPRRSSSSTTTRRSAGGRRRHPAGRARRRRVPAAGVPGRLARRRAGARRCALLTGAAQEVQRAPGPRPPPPRPARAGRGRHPHPHVQRHARPARGARSTCSATSSPTPGTSCAPRSPSSAGTSSCSATTRTTGATPSRLVTQELDRMSRMVDDLLTLAGPGSRTSCVPRRSTSVGWCAGGEQGRGARARTWRVEAARPWCSSGRRAAAHAGAHAAGGQRRGAHRADDVVDLGAAVADERAHLWVVDGGTVSRRRTGTASSTVRPVRRRPRPPRRLRARPVHRLGHRRRARRAGRAAEHPGTGSAFVLVLPLAGDQQEDADPAAGALSRA